MVHSTSAGRDDARTVCALRRGLLQAPCPFSIHSLLCCLEEQTCPKRVKIQHLNLHFFLDLFDYKNNQKMFKYTLEKNLCCACLLFYLLQHFLGPHLRPAGVGGMISPGFSEWRQVPQLLYLESLIHIPCQPLGLKPLQQAMQKCFLCSVRRDAEPEQSFCDKNNCS